MGKKEEGKIGLRASMNRTLRFGLVSVEVGMAPATDDAKPRLSANYICPEHGAQVKQRYECGCDGGHMVDGRPEKGYKWGEAFVVLDDSELPRVEGDSTITLEANVPDADVPSELVEKTRLIWPSGPAHDESFALLAAYLRDNDRALIGNAVESGTTKALVIRYSRTFGTLVAQVLLYDAQVRHANIEKVAEHVAKTEVSPEMAAMAKTLLDGIPGEFDWQGVEDEYGERLEEVIRAKAAGVELETPDTEASVEAASSLMDALRASVEAADRDRKEVAA